MANALVLNIDGEEKKFYKANGFTGRQARKGSTLAMTMNAYATKKDGLSIDEVEKFDETIDRMEKMLVEDLYDNQFTVEEFQDGIDGDKYFETLITEISGGNEDVGKKKK
ncbi:hypothetical protein MT339_09010 [Staphylococcus sp. NRL 19/737]|nr:hypothetical protein [Staphylococcus sp. NRL 19/737]MCJ1668535.1 hypothetical protein [Staphylococcus sp. NRL 19/737]